MSPSRSRPRPGIRRLWPADEPALAAHFIRLDPASRRLRFLGGAGDTFLRDYAAHVLTPHCIAFGAFANGRLRGVAELHGQPATWPSRAEAALSVEAAWQAEGVGEALFAHMIAAAQNRGIRRIQMLCLRENAAMQSLARKHSARLTFASGDVEARLDPPWPTPASLAREALGETSGYLRAVFSLPL